MIQHEVTISLNRPTEQVFAFVTEPSNLAAWQSNLIENELLTEKPLRVGTLFREVRRMGRRPSEIRAEITDFEPNKRFATMTLTEPRASVSYTFDAENGGTRLSYKFVLQTKGIMRLLEPLIASSIKKDTESDFENLKRILES